MVDPAEGTTAIPPALWLVMIGVLVLAIVTAFKPRIAVITGPLYALSMGVVLGAISHIYDAEFGGIVIQAVMATAAVFVVMLVLFVTRTIRVTNRMRGTIIGATAGMIAWDVARVVSKRLAIGSELDSAEVVR